MPLLEQSFCIALKRKVEYEVQSSCTRQGSTCNAANEFKLWGVDLIGVVFEIGCCNAGNKGYERLSPGDYGQNASPMKPPTMATSNLQRIYRTTKASLLGIDGQHLRAFTARGVRSGAAVCNRLYRVAQGRLQHCIASGQPCHEEWPQELEEWFLFARFHDPGRVVAHCDCGAHDAAR